VHKNAKLVLLISFRRHTENAAPEQTTIAAYIQVQLKNFQNVGSVTHEKVVRKKMKENSYEIVRFFSSQQWAPVIS